MFRILTYNIHKGLVIGNQRNVISEIREALHHTDADIVFLQEVSGHNDKKIHQIDGRETPNQFEFLADERWDHYAYGKNAVYQKGHHGNAILSKYPIQAWENFDISTNRFEQRGVIHAEILIQERMVHCFCLHLNLLQNSREKQLNQLIQFVLSKNILEQPILICGDFNDWRKKATAILEEGLGTKEAFFMKHHRYAKTFPSFSPQLCLDRIYVKNLEIKECSLTDDIAWHKLSDHVGLHATFSFN
jgi:endonuclease/exonuclease/phosphatase family metal-dependent hydrolase